MNLVHASNRLSDVLQQKRAKVDSMERDVASRILLHVDTKTYEKMQKNRELREKIRQLKIDCLCLTAEIDTYGGNYSLGYAELKRDASRMMDTNNSVEVNPDDPPPIPPRPKTIAPLQPFSILDVRVPPPPKPWRVCRPESLVPIAASGSSVVHVRRPVPSTPDEENSESEYENDENAYESIYADMNLT